MFRQISNKKIIWSVFFFVLFIMFIFIFLLPKQQFKITVFNPTLSKVSTFTPYIDISFNKPIDKNNISLTSPQNIVYSYSLVFSDTLRVYLKPVLSSTHSYILTINNLSDLSGDKIKNKNISFSPILTSVNSLSPEQASYILQQQSTSIEKVYGTSLVNLLPFVGVGNNYKINYETLNNIQYITITAASTQAQQEARAWILARGYNISSLNIKYIYEHP